MATRNHERFLFYSATRLPKVTPAITKSFAFNAQKTAQININLYLFCRIFVPYSAAIKKFNVFNNCKLVAIKVEAFRLLNET